MTVFPKRPYACIFDVDDTLISNYYPDGTGMHETARYAAIQAAPLHTMESITWTLLQAHGLVRSSEIDQENELLKQIIEIKDEKYLEKLLKDGKEIKGAKKFLHYLKDQGTKLAIASGATFEAIEIDLKIIGASDVFDNENIIGFGSYSVAKPNPEPFLVALRSLNISNTQNVWAFEDDFRGIQSAQEAGLVVCAITSRYTEKQLKPYLKPNDIIVQDFNELMKLSGIK